MLQMEGISLYFLVILVMVLSVQSQGGLKPGFYSSSCPKAEVVVRSTVTSHFNKDPTTAPGLLRLHFHDCFVQVDVIISSFLFVVLIHIVNKEIQNEIFIAITEA